MDFYKTGRISEKRARDDDAEQSYSAPKKVKRCAAASFILFEAKVSVSFEFYLVSF